MITKPKKTPDHLVMIIQLMNIFMTCKDWIKAKNVEASVNKEGCESDETDEYVIDGLSCARPRGSADTRKRAPCAINAKRAKTRPDAVKRELRAIDEKGAKTYADGHKYKAEVVDSSNQKFRKMKTRSTVKNGIE